MKIETITVMQRKNLGNYEHIEISASAKIEEGEDTLSAMLALKTYVITALENKPQEIPEIPVEVSEPVAPKEKKARVKKAKEVVEDPFKGRDIPPVIEEVHKNIVAYNRDLDTHRQLLSSYLTANHPAWKTKEGIKEFSASLVGKNFLDDSGNIVSSFKQSIGEFFGA